jgi:GNAT superfamily N-acetyltransferase
MPYELSRGYRTGAIGRIAELHAIYYSRHWGFGLFFEAKVASEMAAFLQRANDKTDGFWTVHLDGRVEGGITIDGIHAAGDGAHLRWFITSDALRGAGWGNRLMETALTFCREAGHARVYLWTFEGLLEARHLYEKFGFRLTESQTGMQWGTEVTEQKFLLEW